MNKTDTYIIETIHQYTDYETTKSLKYISKYFNKAIGMKHISKMHIDINVLNDKKEQFEKHNIQIKHIKNIKFSVDLLEIFQYYKPESIIFDNSFNYDYTDIFPRELPVFLKSLTFGNDFNKEITHFLFDSNLHNLTFGYSFNSNVYFLPLSLKTLTFGHNYDKKIYLNYLRELNKLTFGYSFNQELQNNMFPVSLHTLIFGNCYNLPLCKKVLPLLLHTLVFGNCYNQPLCKDVLPQLLNTLIFGNRFNKPLNNLPNKLKELVLSSSFNKIIKENSFLKITFVEN